MSQTWSPSSYQQNAAFVPALGAPLLARLAAQPGERILDLGCGDGTLTEQIKAAGASVVGIDSSPEMIAGAARRGLDARLIDATALRFDAEFDAVFTNAVLHWIADADAVLAGVARALKPGGRFVGEFGGHTNIAAISVAMRAVFARHGIPYTRHWYYPTADEYRDRLEANGFSIDDIRLFPRPTPLPTGMTGWLRTFAVSQFSAVPEADRARIEEEVVALLRPSLCDRSGQWTADYVRLQFVARSSRTTMSVPRRR
jgi:trans-aconitate methyltransferase